MGNVTVKVSPAKGVISLKTDLGATATAYAVQKAAGLALPERGRAVASDDGAVFWMAPDELLVLCPRDKARQTLDVLSSAFGDGHFLAADISDARAWFTLDGPETEVREVLARLTPADMHPDTFRAGQVRRTRLAQVAAGIWMKDGMAEVFAFQSVADYVHGLLAAAAKGAPVGHF